MIRQPALVPPLVIEFFGMPGSGKTTVATLVINCLREQGIPVCDGAEITCDHLPKAARSRARLALILREFPKIVRLVPWLVSVLMLKQATQRDRMKSVFVCTTVASMLARLERRGETAVLDQGPAQAIWTALLKSDGRGSVQSGHGNMRNLLNRHKWHVVILDTPDETIRQRLDARNSKHSRMQSPSVSEDSALWSHARDILESIADDLNAASAEGKVSITRVSSCRHQPSEIARMVYEGVL